MPYARALPFLVLILLQACARHAESGDTAATAAATYTPDWASLATIDREPEWWKDAKLGIYFHWGPYSVPAYDTEWYPRFMYSPDANPKSVYAHHQATYGPDFNYHDFVPQFTAEQYDPADWADLFDRAGAKFAGLVAQHHDGFALWDSDVNPWNAADKGPQRDVLGDLYAELREHDMKTIATFHHARTRQRYAQDSTEWVGGSGDMGWNSHYPYHPDLITSTTDPELRYLYGNLGEEEFNDYWLAEVEEVIDKYHPDVIWFDSWLDIMPESYRQRMVAHQFNTGVANGQAPIVAYKQEDLPANVGMLDIEQGGKTDISDDYWLTDVTLSNHSWSYIDGQTYKDPALVIRNMIDVWSKRGIVLLNVSPRADGVINQEQRDVLAVIGDWIDRHEEAVYPTRGYELFGYGDAEFEEGHFGGQSATMQYTNHDIRFTRARDGHAVYVYVLGMPEPGTALRLRHLVTENDGRSIDGITLVGSGTAVDFAVEGQEVILRTPAATEMDEIATVFRVDLQ